jgi:hypothetical protein
MINKLVNVRIPEVLLKNSEIVIKNEGYANIQDLIRDTLRQHVKKYLLQQLKGSVKEKQLNRKEILKEFIKEKKQGKDYFKKFGLK